MDASKIAAARGTPSLNISDAQAYRAALANALRDMADEIESGFRIVTEIQTYEVARQDQPPVSTLHCCSYLPKVPIIKTVKE